MEGRRQGGREKEPAAAQEEGGADKKGVEMAGWGVMVEEMCLTSDLSTRPGQNNGSLSAIVAAAQRRFLLALTLAKLIEQDERQEVQEGEGLLG